ncbi:MAG TPA: 4Fe-4S dicluster domain-containing protein [Saprospiraceae bacterium]|nr:4Fe-4S dicluster domain-containing protein [Saprospiraceae bacterium]
MAIKITDDCINCDACISECPNNAIYEPDEEWSMADGTALDDDTKHEPLSDEFYYIVADKCTECKGFHDEPQCAAVCPVDCCVPDENHVETEEELLAKKAKLHGE